MKFPRRGLYGITDSDLIADNQLVAAVESAIDGGAGVIQYRDKSGHTERRSGAAAALQALCQRKGIPLIINDDVALAKATRAGVHLGKSDATLETARAELDRDAIIGVSCYDDLNAAIDAQSRGADYVAFGRFFPSQTKPQAPSVNTALLEGARQAVTIPIVAIGGITADNGAELIASGADVLAVIHGLFGQADTQGAARAICALF